MQLVTIQLLRFGQFSVATCLLALLVSVVNAQEAPLVQQPSAPPPAKVITKEDRTRISASKDDKTRLRTTIGIAEEHLTQAENRTTNEEFESASASLGKYQALIADALSFLGAMSRDENRVRDLYKRLELSLRAHGPRLTAIRRSTPLEYAVWIKEIEEFARNGRTEALNSFYGTTVIKEPQSKAEKDTRPKHKSLTPSPN